MKEFKILENVYLPNVTLKRVVVFTGAREGRIEDEAGNVTCLFSFETFSNVTIESLKTGQTYRSAGLPIDHAMRRLVSTIHGAYTKRQQCSDYAA